MNKFKCATFEFVNIRIPITIICRIVATLRYLSWPGASLLFWPMPIKNVASIRFSCAADGGGADMLVVRGSTSLLHRLSSNDGRDDSQAGLDLTTRRRNKTGDREP